MFNFKKPLVSVVLASYNHVNFIEQAVKTVLDQTMPDLELLIIDDGSTDGTPDVVEKIHDKRLTLIKLKPNRRYHPRNTGIKMAKGRYIAFQNSDDVWLPDKLKKQVEFMEKNKQTSVCFTRLKMIDEKGKIIRNSWAHKNLAGGNKNNDAWLRLFFTSGFNFGIASALARKEKIIKLGGFNESMVQMADYDLWVRLAGLGQIHIIDEILTKMRIIKGVNFSSPKKAVYLRTQGYSYSEIKSQINVSKSTLSEWLRYIPLRNSYKERLYNKGVIARALGSKALKEYRIQKT